jgi:hypothetical protein
VTGQEGADRAPGPEEVGQVAPSSTLGRPMEALLERANRHPIRWEVIRWSMSLAVMASFWWSSAWPRWVAVPAVVALLVINVVATVAVIQLLWMRRRLRRSEAQLAEALAERAGIDADAIVSAEIRRLAVEPQCPTCGSVDPRHDALAGRCRNEWHAARAWLEAGAGPYRPGP